MKSDMALESVEASDNYFLNNSKALLVSALKALVNNSGSGISHLIDDFKGSQSSIKMLKIISSLIEKPEIGQYIIEDILLGKEERPLLGSTSTFQRAVSSCFIGMNQFSRRKVDCRESAGRT
jgi:hypothetical protein